MDSQLITHWYVSQHISLDSFAYDIRLWHFGYIQIGAEALHCRNQTSLFDISYFCKILLTGPDAKAAIDWICTADMDKPVDS